MNQDLVHITRHADRLAVTLNRPEKANAMTAQMMQALAGAAAGAREGDVLVLDSASPALFCAGADIAEFAAGAGALAAQEHALLNMITAFARCPAPLVAVARGRAAGAGAILLGLADLVIAADDLQIAAPEIRFGMYPVIVEAVLQSRVAPALSQRLCLGGASLSAEDACRAGLVTEVLPADGFGLAAQARVDWYLERSSGLHTARQARQRTQPPQAVLARVRAVAPLMAENYERPGVRDRILGYLDALGARARSPQHG